MGLMGSKAVVKPAAKEEFDAQRFYTCVKALESKLNGLRREFELLKNNITRSSGEMKQDLSALNSDMVDFSHKQGKMLENMNLMIKELKQTAGSEELDVLKKYMEFWNPMNFVTEKDVERLIERKLADQKSSGKVTKSKAKEIK